MMRLWGALFISLLLLLPTAGAVKERLGPIEIEVALEKMPNCTVGIDAEICLATWDKGDDESRLGDDDINTTRFVKRARLSVKTPHGPSQNIEVDPSKVVIYHPLNPIVNGTWIQLNDSRPDPLKPHVEFQSRELYGYEGEWALLLQVNFPMSIQNPLTGKQQTWTRVPVIFWDCSSYFTDENRGDEVCTEDSIRPAPNGLRDRNATADGIVEFSLRHIPCENGYTNFSYLLCPVFDIGDSTGSEIVYVWKNETPNVGFGTGVEEVAAKVGPSNSHGDFAPTGENHTSPFASTDSFTAPSFASPDELRTLPRIPMETDSSTPGKTGRDSGGAAVGFSLKSTGEAASDDGAWAGVALVAALAGLLLSFALVLYHRISRGRVLDNPNRARIFEAIQKRPGIRAGTLKRELDLNYETVLRHLRTLQRFGMVEGVGDGQRRFFVNGGAYSKREKAEVVAASSPAAKAILKYLSKHGRVDFASLRQALRLPRSTASETVTRLERAGLLLKERAEGKVVIALPAVGGRN